MESSMKSEEIKLSHKKGKIEEDNSGNTNYKKTMVDNSEHKYFYQARLFHNCCGKAGEFEMILSNSE